MNNINEGLLLKEDVYFEMHHIIIEEMGRLRRKHKSGYTICDIIDFIDKLNIALYDLAQKEKDKMLKEYYKSIIGQSDD